MGVQLVDAANADVGLERELAEILLDCIEGGATLGFPAGVPIENLQRWWSESLRSPGTLTWAARDRDGSAVGVVQLKLSAMPNGAHRAEVAKLLVHRNARGRGVSSALMAALEAQARARGRWLLMLDTEAGSPAELVYEKWGWTRFGLLQDHACTPSGALSATSFMTKRL